ncbi:hypothetical protein JXQ70_00220 [bacterium]|nr:hypothetical protein [bacterium]
MNTEKPGSLLTTPHPGPRFVRDFPLRIDQKAVFRLQGYRREQDVPDETVQALYRDMRQTAAPLLKPRGYLVYYPIKTIDPGRTEIVLENGRSLIGQNISRTFAGAVCLAIGLVTIGPELEQTVSALVGRTELAQGLMLDSIGSEAAEAAAIYLNELISTQLQPFNWRRTPRMSPGYGSFDITQQRQLFALLDAEQVGVSLTDSCIMQPQKSISFVVGCGPNVKHYKTFSPCRVCDAVNCPARDPDSLRCNQ